MRRAIVVVGSVLALFISAVPGHAGSSGTLVFSVFAKSSTKAGLHTMPSSGGTETKLAGTDRAYRPRWSPDGYGLAYIHGRSIHWIDADGSNDHLLIGRAAMPAHHPIPNTIAWSPDGTQLLLSMYTRNLRSARLYRVTLATKHFHVVIKGSTQADWSSTDRIVAVKADSVVTVDPDGSNRTLIYDHGATWVRWSPDGTKLVLQRSIKASGDIFVMGADGSNATNLTHSKYYDWSPSWSPDGAQIVWSRSRRVFDPGDLFVMNADGSNRTELTATSKLDEYEPDWKA
jgi:Tol biopolymer transport system component